MIRAFSCMPGGANRSPDKRRFLCGDNPDRVVDYWHKRATDRPEKWLPLVASCHFESKWSVGAIETPGWRETKTVGWLRPCRRRLSAAK